MSDPIANLMTVIILAFLALYTRQQNKDTRAHFDRRLEGSQQKVEQAVMTFDQFQTTLTSINSLLVSYAASAADYRQTISDQNSVIAGYRLDNQKLTATFSDTLRVVRDEKAELELKYEEGKRRIKTYEEMTEGLMADMELRKVDSARRDAELIDLRQCITDVNTALSGTQGQLNDTQGEVERLTTELRETRAELEKAKARILELETERSETEREKKRLTEELAAERSKVAELQAKVKKLEAEVARLNALPAASPNSPEGL